MCVAIETFAAEQLSPEEINGAKTLESKFGERLKTLEGGTLELKQTGEAIRLRAAQEQARDKLLEFAVRPAQGATATGTR